MESSVTAESSSFDIGGLLLAGVLITILLLPISILFLSQKPIPTLTENDAAIFPSLTVSSVNDSITSSESKVALLPDSNSTTDTNVVDDTLSNWRCACEGGFLPAGLLGNMESVLKMGTGQCYHKSAA